MDTDKHDDNLPQNNLVDQYANKVIGTVLVWLSSYGWTILIGSVIIVAVYRRYIRAAIDKRLAKNDEQEYLEMYHKDPETEKRHKDMMISARMQLQDAYETQSRISAEKQKEKEEKIKAERLNQLRSSGVGECLGGKKTSEKWKPDYNPLTGSGGGSSYRPPRRTACSRGGCG